MLKYNANIKDTAYEITTVNVDTYTISNIEYNGNQMISVKCQPSASSDRCFVGEELTVTSSREIENDFDGGESLCDIQSVKAIVKTSNPETLEYTFIAPRFRRIIVNEINEIIDENDVVFWELIFNDGHFFTSEDEITITLGYGLSSKEQIILDDIEYVDCKRLMWEVRADIDNFDVLYNWIFTYTDGLSNRITVTRTQTLFEEFYNHDASDTPIFTLIRPKIRINVPIIETFDTRLLQQNLLDNEFISTEISKSVPSELDMEKVMYNPVIFNSNSSTYTNITKINFNLHFREHSGENWTVQENDDWNFSKYGYNQSNDSYYSYPSINESNQSDLLGYLGFNNMDVMYQKNKLQKSFLRLSYYDTCNPMNQNLLGYSTIFFNTNNLYSKYMKGQMLDGWFVNESDVINKYDKISTKSELDTKSASSKVPINIRNNIEKIEDLRLSSQFTVQDKYSSHISSEGFYLYLWADNKTDIPEHLYMKVEFNHAGYGRTIPMMAPYYINGVEDIPVGHSQQLFKTNKEIKSDWEGPGYGIMKYNAYSYLKLKYVYDINTKKYIYFFDPDVYGTLQGPILNINLYEARISF